MPGFDNSAASYTYGKTPSDIAYCGPYLVSNFTSENTIVFTANPAYWNKDNITIKTLTWLYNDGQDALKGYNDTMSGVLDGARPERLRCRAGQDRRACLTPWPTFPPPTRLPSARS